MPAHCRTPWQEDEAQLLCTLTLIKRHIGPEESDHNRDLHDAVQLLVSVSRRIGHLEAK